MTVSNHPDTECSGQQSSAGATPLVGAPPLAADVKKFVQEQFTLLLHADECQRRENESYEPTECSLPYCEAMKYVRSHMRACKAGMSCEVPLCYSSHYILTHWDNCLLNVCPLCVPLKEVSDRQQQQAGQSSWDIQSKIKRPFKMSSHVAECMQRRIFNQTNNVIASMKKFGVEETCERLKISNEINLLTSKLMERSLMIDSDENRKIMIEIFNQIQKIRECLDIIRKIDWDVIAKIMDSYVEEKLTGCRKILIANSRALTTTPVSSDSQFSRGSNSFAILAPEDNFLQRVLDAQKKLAEWRKERQMRKKKNVVVNLEFGHTVREREQPTEEGHTHDFQVFVRGADGSAIEHFISTVAFRLDGYCRPIRARREPPFQIEVSGSAAFTGAIYVYFRTKEEEPKKISHTFDINLNSGGNVRPERLVFWYPGAEFKEKLLLGGGVPSDIDDEIIRKR